MSAPSNPEHAALLQQAAVKLKSLQSRVRELERARTEPIAIVGAGCRFPGGSCDLDSFWRFLRDGGDGVVEVPADRWDVDAYYHEDPSTPGKTNTRRAGFIDEVDRFDPYFFGISPRESMGMDPQQRLFLEVAWEALEDAGQPAESLRGTSTGVFVGVFSNDYQLMQFADPEAIDVYSNSGTGCAIPGRLSFALDLRGPCVAVDTACSSSLTAIHLACQSLRAGDNERAIVGGVNLMLSPISTVALSKLQALSPDGLCKTFSARADGMGRGEGCGVVVLERLRDAVAAGRTIRAVIRGSAINQDGRSSSFTSPNAMAQREVIRQALDNARVSPQEVRYIEAHGTGTALGDPIEIDALTAIYGQAPARHRCGVGSVKTNFGHLEAAAGMAGLLKVVCALEHRTIPAHLHCDALNPHLSLADTPFFIPTETQPWPTGDGPLIGAVSSFGLNGSNAHIVVEQAPAPAAPAVATLAAASESRSGQPYVLPLSARNPEALRTLAARYRDLCNALDRADADPSATVRDLCFSASTRRTHLEHRLTVVGATFADLQQALDGFVGGDDRNALAVKSATADLDRRHGVAYVFAPHGSQWAGFGRGLIGAQAPAEIRRVVGGQLERCAELMKDHVSWSLFDYLLGDDDSWLEEVDIFQPVLFALHVSLAELYRAWGIGADAVVGHSMGEVGAACWAGALSLEDAVRITCRRSGLLKQTAGQGAMGVVELSMDEARVAIAGYRDRLAIAVNNSPRSTVLSGHPDALEEVFERLLDQGVFCGWGVANVASHSPLMDQLSVQLLQELDDIRPNKPALPIYSTVLGERLPTGQLVGARYWYDNLREPVLFADAIGAMLADGYDTFIELSPHPISLPALEDLMRHHDRPGLAVASLHREQPNSLLGSLAQLHVHGRTPDWRRYYPDVARAVPLPSYPWQRERFWFEPTRPAHNRSKSRTRAHGHPFLGAHWEASMPAGAHYFEIELDGAGLAYLADHLVQDIAVLPAVTYLEMALAGAREIFGAGAHTLTSVHFQKLLIRPDNHSDSERPRQPKIQQTVQLAFAPSSAAQNGDELSFQVASRRITADGEASAWTVHVTGTLGPNSPEDSSEAAEPPVLRPPAELCERLSRTFDERDYLTAVTERGVYFGERFRAIRRVWRGEREVVTQLELPASLAADAHAYQIHPVLLDACFQGVGLMALLPGGDDVALDGLFLPVSVDELRVHRPITGDGAAAADGSSTRTIFGHAILTGTASGPDPVTSHSLSGDVAIVDEHGQIMVEARGLTFKRFDDALTEHLDAPFYRIEWRRRDPELPASQNNPPGVSASHGPGAGGYLLLLPTAAETAVDAQSTAQARALQSLVAHLTADGTRCVTVTPGANNAAVGADAYVVNPDRVEDFRTLLAHAFDDDRPCRAVVSLWSLATARQPTSLADLLSAQTLGYISVLHLVQALAALGSRRPPQLFLVTCGVHRLGDDGETTSVTHGPIWGLGRTISHEFPEFRCTRIDLPAEFAAGPENRLPSRPDDELPADIAAAVATLAREIRLPGGDDQLALRAGAVHGARLATWSPPQRARDGRPNALLRADATYLITGGTSGIGLSLASWLVAEGVRHLVLISRSGGDDQARAEIDELRTRGAQVVVERADVSDPAAMTAVMARIDTDLPALRGVIHSAVLLDDGILLRQTAERFRPVMAAKMDGAWLLHELTRARPLDFFILFSSGNSLLGSPGESSYAAANAFVDALAHHRRSLGLPGLSINWGPWTDIGLGAALDKRGERIGYRGIAGMSPAQGHELFGQLLAHAGPEHGQAQVGVFHLDLRQWRQYYPRSAKSPLLSELTAHRRVAPGQRAGRLRAAILATPEDQREALLADGIRRHIADVLRLDLGRINPDTPLDTLGFDSLMAVELRNLLEVQLDATLPVTLIWGYPTVAALAPHLARKLGFLAEGQPADSGAKSPESTAAPGDQEHSQNDQGRALTHVLSSVEELSDESALELLLRGATEKTRQ